MQAPTATGLEQPSASPAGELHPLYGKPPFAAQMTVAELKEFQKQLAYDMFQATKSYAGQPGQW
jgi:hypothetical protein